MLEAVSPGLMTHGLVPWFSVHVVISVDNTGRSCRGGYQGLLSILLSLPPHSWLLLPRSLSCARRVGGTTAGVLSSPFEVGLHDNVPREEDTPRNTEKRYSRVPTLIRAPSI